VVTGVRELRAQVFVHATEDKERVMKALMELFPSDVRSRVSIEEERLEGHYGNPIIKIVARVVGEDAVRTFRHILSRLSRIDREALRGTLEDRVDKEGTLYFRLSKQEAYLGGLTVYEADDVIRVTVHFEGRRRRAMGEYDRALSEAGSG
jgi:RNA binding exosome subunit